VSAHIQRMCANTMRVGVAPDCDNPAIIVGTHRKGDGDGGCGFPGNSTHWVA